MTRKVKIQVAGNPQYAKPISKNASVDNPDTGTPLFGTFPDIPKHDFPSGPIYLRHGDHTAKNKGFGLVHIWEEHFKKHSSVDDAKIEILDLINSIIKNGEIYYEYGEKNIIYKRKAGIVILQLKYDGLNKPFYSIVTAYTGGNPHGTKIGQIKN